ncbi:MAG: glycosyltransferase family 2 protein [Acidobacteriaceae bacterium]|nr:glycosyltransferase family 2 protein [Acidobacteriaceae bacterium]
MEITSAPKIAVTIVTYNSDRYIRRCLESIFKQDHAPEQVIVVDNASRDETPVILREFENLIRVVYNHENIGFAAGQNQAIALSQADWILTLNADVCLTPSFITRILEAGEADSSAGSVCGKLLAAPPDFEIPQTPIVDSTGIYFTPNLRHFDRGSKTSDQGQYERFEYVFGATGAAALYRREMIQDISVFGEFFDSDFFAYREDAELAWRAQLLGWKCLYTPLAVAYHVRNVLPSNRRSLPAIIKMHSVKNRFLLRIKNTTGNVYFSNFLAITLRDLTVIGACLLYEWRSLRAFSFILRNWKRTWAKRDEIMRRRRAGDAYMSAWFSVHPVSYPAAERSSKCALLC